MTSIRTQDTLGRRRFLALSTGTAVSALLAACAGGSTPTETPRPATPTSGAAATTGASSAVTAPTRVASAVTTGSTTAGTTAASSAVMSTRAATMTTGSTTAGSAIAGSAVTTTGSAVTGVTSTAMGQVLAIDATEYAFKTLGSIPAGITIVQLRNLGKEKHEGSLVRLNSGVSLDQVLAALQQQDQGPPPDPFTFEGGPAEVVPNKSSEVILDLQQGSYVLLCTINAPDGQPHAAKGMYLSLNVTAPTGATAALPTGKGTIVLGTAGGFAFPATPTAGRSMYRVTNQGMGPRAFFYGTIPAEKTIDDVNASLNDPNASEPDWFTPFGGMNGLKPNGAGVVTLDLMPGKYVAVDVAFSDERPFGRVFTVT